MNWDFSAAASTGDTCASFASAWGKTVDDFKALNPGVSCPNLTAGQSYCMVGTVTGPTSTTSTTVTTSKSTTAATTTTTSKTVTTTTTTTTGTAPGPTQPGTPADCDKFHLVLSGDTCDTIAAKYSITVAQFKSWNPTIDTGMSWLWIYTLT